MNKGQLNTTIAEIFMPTMTIALDPWKNLKQLWQCKNTGKTEWRNVEDIRIVNKRIGK